MEWSDRIFIFVSRIIPRDYLKNMQQLLVYAGMEQDSKKYLGTFILFGMLAAIIIFLVPKSLHGQFKTSFTLAAIGFFILTQIIAYMIVYFKAEERTRAVEEALPDAFQMIASNLRSGMTPFKALKLSTHKGLGPLEKEIEYATSMALGTESFSETLLRISDNIQSDLLDRSLKLFTTAMQSGGRLAQVLEELASDISETNALKRELTTSTKTYTAFIMFTIIIGAPLLLAISINFVRMIESMQSNISMSSEFGMGFLMGELAITPSFLSKLSSVIIVLTSILASMLLGVINHGRPMSGLRYSLTIMAGSFLVFFISGHFVGNFLIGMG